MKDQHGLQVWLDAKASLIELDSHLRMLMFQTIRELLFNVVKHAETSQVTIMLEKIAERGRITISDTGKGFDVSMVMGDTRTAHGLLVINDRLGLMGCSMEIASEPGRGTDIMIEMPLSGNSVFSEIK
jgi:signal transduction histidine kinase